MLIEAAARLEPEALRCPFPAYDELREHGITLVEAADAFLVTRAEDIEAVLRDADTFSSRNAIGAPPIPPDSEMAKYVPFLLLSDEPEHAQRRRLVQRAFTPSRLARFEPQVRELCEELVAGFRGRDEVEFMQAFAVPLPIAVITTVLGVPGTQLPAFRSLSEELAATVGNHAADPADIVRIAKSFAALLAPALDSAAEEDGTILATIATAEKQDGLPRHDAARFVMELLIAGNITTTDHIGSTMLLLARRPELVGQLQRDPSQLAAFIEESLRLESPIQGLFRITTRDVVVGGTPIQAGSRVQVMYGAGNRDPQAFPAPDELDLGRRAAGHLAFGRGRHSCLGSIIARLESRVAFETLLTALQGFSLAVDEVDYLPSFVNRGPRALPLRLQW